MAREIRTRTTIETESISIIACRQVIGDGCERCGREVEMAAVEIVPSLIGTLPHPLQRGGPWLRARHGLVTSLKTLLRYLENADTGTPPHS